MGVLPKERALDRIAELSRRGQDLATFWLEASEVLESAVPHYWAPCWYTLDPASLLITSQGPAQLEQARQPRIDEAAERLVVPVIAHRP